jgi:hypothetical protein
MSQFMSPLDDSPADFAHLSPEEMQPVIERYRAWGQRLRESGRLGRSAKLKEEGGKGLTTCQDRLTVVAGPYTETREGLGGYITIRAESNDEAVGLAGDCPRLAQGGKRVIREVDAV